MPHQVGDVDILVDGTPQRRYVHDGRWYVEALKGREYAIRLRNPYAVRVAMALSVDGLNTIDARRTTAVDARKWVLDPYEHGIQQLAGAIEHYRHIEETPRAFGVGSPLHQLSSRERQVLDLLGLGYRPRSIAEKLHVSPETVRNHLKAMFKKTGTHSQEELIAMFRSSADLS